MFTNDLVDAGAFSDERNVFVLDASHGLESRTAASGRRMSDPVRRFRWVNNSSTFRSGLPDAQRAAAGLAPEPVVATGVEAALVTALEDAFLEFLNSAVPGLELQQALLAFPPRLLGASAQLEWLRAHARCTAWWAAKEAEALVAYAGDRTQLQSFDVRGEQVVLEDVAREEVAVALRWTSNYAQSRIDEARTLVGSLPNTKVALELGEISPAHMRVITESATKLAVTAPVGTARFASACEQLERRVLPIATHHGLSRTRSAANRAVAAIDPEGRGPRRDAAYKSRGVWLRDDGEGISTIIGRLATEHGHAVMNAIEHLARVNTSGTDGLGMGERRSIALLRLVLGGSSALSGDASSVTRGTSAVQAAELPPIRTHVEVIVDLPTLMGLQDNDGEVVGGGAISAESIRALVTSDKSATMRRLVTDPTTGHLLDIGRRRYVIPDSLREFIAIRDQRCRFPGCNARAASAEIDHALPWDDGGRSDRENLGALCKRHHQVKTLGGWSITSSAESGECEWRAPSGATYAHDAVAMDGRLLDRDPTKRSAEPDVPLPHGRVGEARNLIDDDS